MTSIVNVKTQAALQEAAAALAKVGPTLGYQGKLNIYTCDRCFDHIVTRDVDQGVTPFLVGCKCSPHCKGMMRSSMYRVWDQEMREDYQWYRPQPDQELNPGELAHVAKGGLLMRPRP